VRPVCILGGGPAGSTAAIAACREGADVNLIERSRFPRHKVCGEFLSPGVEAAFDGLGLWSEFQALHPARIRRMLIRVGGAEKSAALPEAGYGLSRYALDGWLWNSALHGGTHPSEAGEPDIVATGRSSTTPRGGRLFGFKAHFRGPADDAVELYFAGKMYVGVNCVEGGLTNVCGLAPEEHLKRHCFDVDAMIAKESPVRARLQPLRREWDWIFTGPLEFGNKLAAPTAGRYLAGDALSFVDPFTGSGLLCSVLTGSLAGRAAARRMPVPDYVRKCAGLLRKPFSFSSVLRQIASTRAAGPLLRLVPASLIFRWTRP
jgi:menaquinone-9 beta-reductase